MKSRLILIVLAVVLLPVSYILGQAIFTMYSGIYTPVGILNPGTVECPGGQPSGLWPLGPPCSPLESRVHIRKMVRTFQQNSTDPRSKGLLIIELNANFDGWPGTGRMWGTGRLEVSEGEVWEGSWTGERTLAGETVRSVLHGRGGMIEGLQKQEEASRGNVPIWVVSGRILQPGGK